MCGQAQKSIAWTNLQRLYARLEQQKATFVRGCLNDLTALVENGKALGKRFEVVVVQPGVSRAKLSPAMAENLVQPTIMLLVLDVNRFA